MWWYRDKQTDPKDGSPQPAGTEPGPLVAALRTALSGLPQDPQQVLAMCLLVDSRIETADGHVQDGFAWGDAEKFVEEAVGAGRPLRLYNQFSKDFGEGYTTRDDMPDAHRQALSALRDALAAAPGVVSVTEREAPEEDDEEWVAAAPGDGSDTETAQDREFQDREPGDQAPTGTTNPAGDGGEEDTGELDTGELDTGDLDTGDLDTVDLTA